jgi:hypothetical protein
MVIQMLWGFKTVKKSGYGFQQDGLIVKLAVVKFA